MHSVINVLKVGGMSWKLLHANEALRVELEKFEKKWSVSSWDWIMYFLGDVYFSEVTLKLLTNTYCC